MGLASYGTPRQEWFSEFEKFYEGVQGSMGYDKQYHQLKNTLGFPDEYDGQLEADIVATAQRMFEIKFDKLVRPYFNDQSTFLLTGGCAMNITNNQRLRNERKIFVPPNPHDGGLSLGFMLDYLKPEKAYDATYSGPPVWDYFLLGEYVEKYNAKSYTFNEIVSDLIDGKIIGVVRGGSELGPRALGNRSIICHAAIPGMKDILNKKVKNRELFRPFAPVCRVDEANKFFELNGFDENRWMTFCPKVKMEHRDALASITHIDGTARLQTVKDFQHEWFYYVLGMLMERHPYPVLLNTSFNIAGKPILNSYRDALWMFENTEMDGLILEDYYIKKNK
jgi:carbamoyltransferase